MPEIDITITNLPQIRAAFKQAPTLMRRNVNTAIRKTVINIQGKESTEYKALGIRVISGGLINSIRRGVWYGDLQAEVGPNVKGSPGVDYAGYVHEGTRFMKSRPYLLQAVGVAQHETDEFFVAAVEKTLSEIGAMV